MTFAEAEIFFKKYNGQGFHMLREESKVYKEYYQLGISKEQEDIWRVQKIEAYYECIHSGKEKAWVCFGNIIEMMHDLAEVSDELLERLLDALRYISKLDVRQRILVMEDMEGRNNNKRSRSGYALYKSRNKYFAELQRTMAQIIQMSEADMDEMERLSASGEMGWTDTYQRYRSSLNRCERAEESLLSGESFENNSQDEKYDYWKKWLELDVQK